MESLNFQDDSQSFGIQPNENQSEELDFSDQGESFQSHNQVRQDENEEEDDQSEEVDQVHDLSFNQNQLVGQSELEEEQSDQEDQEDLEDQDQDQEGSDDEEDMGEMKAKFDKIMSNFVDENKPKNGEQKHVKGNKDKGNDDGIYEFKNKNIKNNMKDFFQQNEQDKEDEEDLDEDEVSHAIVEGPNKENIDGSVNIQIQNKNLFANMKPPVNPQKDKVNKNIVNQVNESEQVLQKKASKKRSFTPERDGMSVGGDQSLQSKKRMNFKDKSSERNLNNEKKIQEKIRKRPQTAHVKKEKENINLENNCEIEQMPRKQVLQKMPLMQRPQTANPIVGKQIIINSMNNKVQKGKGAKQQKKSDPVSRHQNMQQSWKKSAFLSANKHKQGRKLDLDRFHRWSTLVHAHNTVTATKNNNHNQKKTKKEGKAPTEDRRDDLRFNLRAKLSQKDYVDKNMKAFHYQNGSQNAIASNASRAELDRKIKQQQRQRQQQPAMQLEDEDLDIGGAATVEQLELIKKQILMLKKQKQLETN